MHVVISSERAMPLEALQGFPCHVAYETHQAFHCHLIDIQIWRWVRGWTQHQRKGNNNNNNNNNSKRHLMSHLNSPGVVTLLYCQVEKEALDVASDDPPDEALSCRCRAWDVPYGLATAVRRDALPKTRRHWWSLLFLISLSIYVSIYLSIYLSLSLCLSCVFAAASLWSWIALQCPLLVCVLAWAMED